MKTTITCTVDSDIKEKAMPIIQNKLHTTISKLVNDALIKVLSDDNSNQDAPKV